MPIRSYWKVVVKRVKKAKRFVRARPHYALFAAAGIGVLLLIGAYWTLFAPQTVSYDFGKAQTCQTSPRLFPRASKIKTSEPLELNRPASLSVGSLALYSSRLCATARSAPKEQAEYSYKERLFGMPFLGHSVHVATNKYPALAHPLRDRKMVSPTGTLSFPLNQPDATFTYAIKAGELTAPCAVKQAVVGCELEPLQFIYAQRYDPVVVRQFHKKTVSTVTTAPIETLTPITVVATSIAAGAVVQEKPTGLTIQTDKKLTNMGSVVLVAKNGDNTETVIPTSATFADTSVTVTFNQELARKTSFELRIASLSAQDGSGLAGKSLAILFSTSGGPRVTGSNIGSRNVAPSQTMAITFDQTLLAGQNLAPIVTLVVLGTPQPATISISGNRILVTPASPLPLCATFTIKITGAVQSKFGISGDSAWTMNSRAICYTTFSIGTSVRGRAITAYKFGSGANPIVYMGAMHGSEANSKTLMTEWFNELNANPQRLGTRSIVVIPAVNPDGIASGSRLNANGIDLNRNFPASDWKSVVTSPQSPNPTPAGGPNPLSEPESRAVAAYIQQVQPRLVMSFHSAAAVVEANESGDSVGIASTYAAKARYRAVPKSQSAPIFQYDTTGAMEDWMRTSLGRPAIVVELLSHTSSEFSRNRDALWYIAGL